MSTTNPMPAAKPGRKALTPTQRRELLERSLKAAKRAEREDEQRKLATIGAALREEAKSDPTFMARVLDIVARRDTTPAGKTAIAWLKEDVSSQAPAADRAAA